MSFILMLFLNRIAFTVSKSDLFIIMLWPQLQLLMCVGVRTTLEFILFNRSNLSDFNANVIEGKLI